jgi:hypothetical protein
MNKMCVKNDVKFFMLFACLACLLFATNIFAAVMSSTNYKIQSDDLSPSGGQWSSANYIFKDTLGEFSTGRADSDSFNVRAGYQEMQEVFISISSPGNAVMKPDIQGISGGTAATSSAFYVITDSSSGFNLKINASSVPAMQLVGDPTHYFSDYPTTPTYNWNVAPGNSQFGFTIEPGTEADVSEGFLDNGAACGSGSYHADTCWSGFKGTDLTTIINRTSRTSDNPGELETVKFQAQSNDNFLLSGSYSATITITASSN